MEYFVRTVERIMLYWAAISGVASSEAHCLITINSEAHCLISPRVNLLLLHLQGLPLVLHHPWVFLCPVCALPDEAYKTLETGRYESASSYYTSTAYGIHGIPL